MSTVNTTQAYVSALHGYAAQTQGVSHLQHIVPAHRLGKHEQSCPANPHPTTAKAQEKRERYLQNGGMPSAPYTQVILSPSSALHKSA